MTLIQDLPTPALVLDRVVLERNLQAMSRKAAALGVALRPHVKTHKCREIGRRQRELGARGITVATLYEGRVFAAAGFDDITWAFPLVPSRLPEAAELAAEVVLRLVVDSLDAVGILEEFGHPFHVWLKVDCGYHRAGVDPGSSLAVEIARVLTASKLLTFDGILTHSGHAYYARGRAALARVAEEERSVMSGFAEGLRREGMVVEGVSVGSTPALSVVESLAGVTEVRPGNYAFYDGMQIDLGSCGVADCALSVIASVVSSSPATGRAVIDAGALALSKDPGIGVGVMGRLLDGEGGLLAGARLTSLSQEHGIVEDLDRPLPVGARVRVLPNHSCLAAACFDAYQVVEGDRVIESWKIWRGR